MPTTLITILGKGRYDPIKGYQTATYAFPDGQTLTTPYFGLALAQRLQPQDIILLGTPGSMWDVLIEHHLSHTTEHEALRLELMEQAQANNVSQALLDRVQPLMQATLGQNITLRLIPNGRDDDQQIDILRVIADTLGKKQAGIHIDITHGFRHLAVVGFLSAAMLERLRSQLTIEALWYGAFEMKEGDKTPVIRLDGLHTVQHWVSALDRFDASGDYSVFAPLLQANGLPADKVQCLVDAAYFEGTTQIPNAARSLNTLLPELEKPLQGASALFQQPLKQRLQWAKQNSLAKQQHQLALRAQQRNDPLRACILGLEALITHQCHNLRLDPHDYQQREEATESLRHAIQNQQLSDWLRKSYQMLNQLRNSMAHGTQPNYKPAAELIKNRQRLSKEIDSILGQIGTHLHG